jgi:type IV secretory pathway VirB10-like protein
VLSNNHEEERGYFAGLYLDSVIDIFLVALVAYCLFALIFFYKKFFCIQEAEVKKDDKPPAAEINRVQPVKEEPAPLKKEAVVSPVREKPHPVVTAKSVDRLEGPVANKSNYNFSFGHGVAVFLHDKLFS